MKYLLSVLVLLFSASLSLAQDSQASQHFVISVNAAGYGGQSGKQAVSLAGAGFQVTKNISASYLSVSNPADSTQPKYHLGVLNYTRQLDALLGKKLTSKVVFDTTNWLVTFQAGAGKVHYADVDRVAEIGGVFISRPIAPNLQITSGIQVLHGQGTSILTRNVTSQPTVGLNFTF